MPYEWENGEVVKVCIGGLWHFATIRGVYDDFMECALETPLEDGGYVTAGFSFFRKPSLGELKEHKLASYDSLYAWEVERKEKEAERQEKRERMARELRLARDMEAQKIIDGMKTLEEMEQEEKTLRRYVYFPTIIVAALLGSVCYVYFGTVWAILVFVALPLAVFIVCNR